MARYCNRWGYERNHSRNKVCSRLKETSPDQRARTENRLTGWLRFEVAKGCLGNELVSPGEGDDEVKAEFAASVCQLNWPRRQRLDKGVCSNYKNRQRFWRLSDIRLHPSLAAEPATSG